MCSFIFTTLIVHTTTQKSPLTIRFCTSFNLYLHIPLLLVHKIFFTISTNTRFLYTSANFTSLFFRTTSQQSTSNFFCLPQPFRQFRLRPRVRELTSIVRSDIVLTSPFFLKAQTVITGLTITDSLSLRLRKLVYCRQQSLMQMLVIIQSTFSHTLSLTPLLSYPINNITRTHISLKTSCLT